MTSKQDAATRARELFEMVGIAAERLKSYPHELSGGMRQRATIAIALALSPELIIMDEPTTALDVVVQREILTELMRLRDQLDLSIIFITHDLSLLLEIADTIAIMYAGRVVETHQRARAPSPATAIPTASACSTRSPRCMASGALMTGIPGSPPDLRAVPSGCAFHPRCPLAFAPCSQTVPVAAASASERDWANRSPAIATIPHTPKACCRRRAPRWRSVATVPYPRRKRQGGVGR